VEDDRPWSRRTVALRGIQESRDHAQESIGVTGKKVE
jgi:hypothetical protein